MKRLAALVILLVIAIACDASGTVTIGGTPVEIGGSPLVIASATPAATPTKVPDANARGNYTGGRIVDFLAPTQALIVRENAVSVRVPRQTTDAKLTVLYMRKAGEWKGTGNAAFTVNDLPAGPLTVQSTGASNIVITWGASTIYLAKSASEIDLHRNAEPLNVTIIAEESWTFMVAAPVLETPR